MPRIPTLLSDASIRTGSTGPEASAPDFSIAPGLAVLSGGLMNAGTEAAHVSAVNASVKAKKAQDDDLRWTTESLAQLNRVLSEYQQNPENQQKETFATDFSKFADQQVAEYTKKAPSTNAVRMFRQHMLPAVNHRYEAALQTTESTKLRNSVAAVDSSVADLMAAYRADSSISPDFATSFVEPGMNVLIDSINQRYGKVAPTTAAKLRESVVSQVVIGTADTSPEFARRILSESKDVDEKTRAALNANIDQAEHANSRMAVTMFTQALQDRIEHARQTNTHVERPSDAAWALLGKNADAAKFQFEQQATIVDRTVDGVAMLKDKNAYWQQTELEKMRANVKTEADSKVVDMLAANLAHNVTQQTKDPSGWLSMNNTDVQEAQRRVESASDAERPLRQRTANDLVLQFQGMPPAGAKPEEAARYLGLPTGARHILSVSQAVNMAQQINGATPNQKVAVLRSFQEAFEDPQQWSKAYNDLVNLPPHGQGVPQPVQLAFLIRDPAKQSEYLGAITNPKAVEKLTPERLKDFETELKGNATWMQFQAAQIGDQLQRVGQIEGFYTGVLQFAHALSLPPHSLNAKRAVEQSIQTTLLDYGDFANVNGQTLLIPKERTGVAIGPNQPDRSVAEIQDTGRRLALALAHIAPQDVKRTDQYGRPLFPNLGDLPPSSLESVQHLRDIITSSGYFVPDADGQSVTLYLKGDGGFNFQVLDQNSQPFRIMLDDLPTFTQQQASPVQARVITVKEQPQKVYNIVGRLQPYGTGYLNPVVTNWPVTASYFINQQMPVPKVERSTQMVPPAPVLQTPPVKVTK